MNPRQLADQGQNGWIAVDLDGTLAHYALGEVYTPDKIGDPIPPMYERVKRWLAEGRDVRIFTARVYSDGTPARDLEVRIARLAIVAWCRKHFNQVIAITCIKDFRMLELWDDRAVQVEANTGKLIGHSTRGFE